MPEIKTSGQFSLELSPAVILSGVERLINTVVTSIMNNIGKEYNGISPGLNEPHRDCQQCQTSEQLIAGAKIGQANRYPFFWSASGKGMMS
jgi:hypothetical protein